MFGCKHMNRKICSVTIKTITRSPVTWICFSAVIMWFIYNMSGEHKPPTTYTFHERMAGYPYGLLQLSIPVFISAIASVDIMKDRKNRFIDIAATSSTGRFTYYSAKISAYLAIGFGVMFLLSYLNFFIDYFKYDMLTNMEYTLPECLWMIAIRCFGYSLAVIPVYISLSVCASLLFRTSVTGVVFSIVYVFTGRYIIPTLHYGLINYESIFVAEYIYHLPQRIFDYFYCLNTRAQPGTADPHVTIPQLMLSYAILACICVVLLTAGYLAYRKQTD